MTVRSIAPGEAGTDGNRAFQAERTRLLYAGLVSAIAASTLNAVVLATVQWSVVEPVWILGWLALFGVVSLSRAAGVVAYRRASANATGDATPWLYRFRLGTLAAGLVWGTGGALLFPSSDAAHQTFVAFILAGVSAGAITSLAVDRVSVMGFLGLTLAPLVTRFLLEGGEIAVAMALMVGSFLAYVALSAVRIQRNLYENMDLRAQAVEREQALSESEARFRDMANAAPALIWLANAQSHCVWCNSRWLDYTGHTLADVSGRCWLKDVHPDDLDRCIRDSAAAIGKRQRFELEYRLRRTDGSYGWIALTGIPRRAAGGAFEGYTGYGWDITERRRMEHALEESRNFLNNVVDTIVDPIFVKDRQHRWVLLNEAFCTFVGYPREELIGKSDFDFFPEHEALVFWEKDEVVLETGQENVNEEEFTDSSGINHTIVTKKSRYTDASGQSFIVGIIQDITARKRTEEALAAREREFRTLAENSPYIIIRYDRQCRVIYVNRMLEKSMDITVESVLNERPSQSQPPGARGLEAYEEALRRVVASGEPAQVEIEVPDPAGELRTHDVRMIAELDANREVVGALIFGHDISDHKAYERTLKENAQHTQSILDNIVDGIITIDIGGIVTSFNRAAETIFGYTSGEVIGQNVSLFMPESYRTGHDGYIQNYLTTKVSRIIGIGREVEGLRKDGTVFPMELAVSQISRQGQRVFIGVVRDITERKRLEQMKSEFVSTVSHELRTPLTSISGALGLIVGEALGGVPAQTKQVLDIAYKNSQRLTLLINDLLDMEKLAAGKMRFDFQVQQLMPLMEQTLDANRAYGARYQVQFEIIEQADDVQVRVDAGRLQQVLSNFLSNAVKYSPEGGRVEVAARRRDGTVRVEVIDHGPGIPQEFRSRIFQKFSQADASDTRQKGGTGLGLAISKELIERMHGLVGFDSEPGRTCFHFELPLWRPQESEAQDEHANIPNAPRLLVVEDDKDAAHLLAMMLRRNRYNVDVAYDGEQTLANLAQHDYAAMTLDLLLPDQSGVALIRQVRSRTATATLPIVVVSACTDDGKFAINGDFPNVDWLDKPTDEEHLLAAVRRALSHGANANK